MLFSSFYLCLLQGINVAQHDFSFKKLWQVELRGRPVSVSRAFEELGTLGCWIEERIPSLVRRWNDGNFMEFCNRNWHLLARLCGWNFWTDLSVASEGCMLQRTVERSFPVHVMLHGFKPTIHCNKAKSSRSGHELSITMAGMDQTPGGLGFCTRMASRCC